MQASQKQSFLHFQQWYLQLSHSKTKNHVRREEDSAERQKSMPKKLRCSDPDLLVTLKFKNEFDVPSRKSYRMYSHIIAGLSNFFLRRSIHGDEREFKWWNCFAGRDSKSFQKSNEIPILLHMYISGHTESQSTANNCGEVATRQQFLAVSPAPNDWRL